MKKIAILLIVLMMVSVGFLSGCIKSDADKIVETWEHSWAGTRITFDSDGKLWGYSQYSPFINYKIEDGYVIYIINGVE
ncbi:MAG: hypothetical protein MUO82_02465, partial [Candidatus Thermoplasmatota archaeon]|nr:hypothetical protein [Candidatus Thermoplasmatota archaeon]